MKLLASGPRDALLRTSPAAMVLRVAFLEGLINHLPPYTGGDLAPEEVAKEWPVELDTQGRRVLWDQFAEIHFTPGGSVEGVTTFGHTYSIVPGRGAAWSLYGDGEGEHMWPYWLSCARDAGCEIHVSIPEPKEEDI